MTIINVVDMNEIQARPIPSMVLHKEDVDEYMDNVTQVELDEIAQLVSDGLMYSWSDALSGAVSIVKQDRK